MSFEEWFITKVPRTRDIFSCRSSRFFHNEQTCHWRPSLLTKMLKPKVLSGLYVFFRHCRFPSLKFRLTDTWAISRLNFQLWTRPPLQLPTASPDNSLTAPADDEGLCWHDWSVFTICAPLKWDGTCALWLDRSGRHWLGLDRTHTHPTLKALSALHICPYWSF